MTALTVALGDRSYPVYFEHAAESALVARVVKTARHGRALVVSDERVARLHGEIAGRLAEAQADADSTIKSSARHLPEEEIERGESDSEASGSGAGA